MKNAKNEFVSWKKLLCLQFNTVVFHQNKMRVMLLYSSTLRIQFADICMIIDTEKLKEKLHCTYQPGSYCDCFCDHC